MIVDITSNFNRIIINAKRYKACVMFLANILIKTICADLIVCKSILLLINIVDNNNWIHKIHKIHNSYFIFISIKHSISLSHLPNNLSFKNWNQISYK